MSFRKKEARKGAPRTGYSQGHPNSMKIITICMTDDMISSINRLVERKEFANFSEAVRYMLKSFLITYGVL